MTLSPTPPLLAALTHACNSLEAQLVTAEQNGTPADSRVLLSEYSTTLVGVLESLLKEQITTLAGGNRV